VSIDALLFDLGGVVIEIDFGRVFARWAAVAGRPVEAIASRFSMDGAYERHERGQIEAGEYFASLRSSLGINLTDAELTDGWNQIYVREIPGVRALLESLAPRVPLYAFTNSNRTHQPYTLRTYGDALKSFRQVFFSCDMGLRKPEPAAFEAIASKHAQAIVAFPDVLMMSQAKAIAAFAAKHRIPAVSGWAEFAGDGNLMTYGPNLRESWRYLATYADKILRGARPSDLPVEQASKFELVVNAKTARALGLRIPPSLLVRADHVIE
jgi:putative hydrolase of the HAD superfamily